MNDQPQDAMDQAQAEQGLAQAWLDDELHRIVQVIAQQTAVSVRDLTLLCGALKIDVRDVT